MPMLRGEARARPHGRAQRGPRSRRHVARRYKFAGRSVDPSAASSPRDAPDRGRRESWRFRRHLWRADSSPPERNRGRSLSNTSEFGRSCLLHRQPGILPGLEAALKVIDVLEAELREQRRRGPPALAAVAVSDDRARNVLGELGATVRELRKRHMERVRQLAASDLLRFPHIEQQRVFCVDELRRAERSDFASAGYAPTDERPDEHRARRNERGEEHPVLFGEGKKRHWISSGSQKVK